MDVARQNIAGAHAAIKFRVERDQSRKDVVAEIEFNIARDPDRNHAHPVLEHALRERNPANSAQNSKMRRSLNPRFRASVAKRTTSGWDTESGSLTASALSPSANARRYRQRYGH